MTSLRSLLGAILLAFLLAVALSELYSVAALLIDRSLWEGAVLIHTAFAVLVLAGWRRWRTPKLTVIALGARDVPLWYAYLPSLVVLAFSLVAGLVSGSERDWQVWTEEAWVMVLWVPLVEEIVFRVGLGGFFRRWLGSVSGGYVSAFLFALVHALPGWSELFRGSLGLPLGPLLLGLFNEALYVKTGRIAPIFVFHAACNATAVIFRMFDPRWLDWLGWFYL